MGLKSTNQEEYVREKQAEIRNELALPRIDETRFRAGEVRAAKNLATLASMARGSQSNVAGASGHNIRRALTQPGDLDSLAQLLSPQYKQVTRKAVVDLVDALSRPDVTIPKDKMSFEWQAEADTKRQRALGNHQLLVHRLIAWLQAAVAKYEDKSNLTASKPSDEKNERRIFLRGEKGIYEAPQTIDSSSENQDNIWPQTDIDRCATVCGCLRSLCVDMKSASRLTDAIPPLLTILKTAPTHLALQAASCLIPLSVWQSRLIVMHGGIPLFLQLLHESQQPLARVSAAHILANLASPDQYAHTHGILILDHGGLELLCTLALKEKGTKSKGLKFHPRQRQMRFELETKCRAAACWVLVRLFNIGDIGRERLTSPAVARVAMAAISDSKASPKVHEAGLLLLRSLVHNAVYELGTAAAGWLNEFARQAAVHVVALLLRRDAKDAVRAQAADCIALLYHTNSERRRLSLGNLLHDDEDDTSPDNGDDVVPRASLEVSLLPGEHHHLVYGTKRACASRRKAISGPSADSSHSALRGSDDTALQHGPVRLISQSIGGLQTPSKRLNVLDDAEVAVMAGQAVLISSQDGSRNVRKRRDSRIPREVSLSDSFEFSWETREQALSQNDCTATKGEIHCEKIDCAEIIDCHAVTAEILASKGLPANRRELDSCFVLRMPKSRIYILAAVRDLPQNANGASFRGSNRRESARDLRNTWIRTLLQARNCGVHARSELVMTVESDENRGAATQMPEKSVAKKLTTKVSKLWKAVGRKQADDYEDHNSSPGKSKSMNAVNPRLWEDMVSAYPETPERYGSHPDVLATLLDMAALPKPLAAHAVAALLNLCLHPRVARFVRDSYQKELHKMVATISMASTIRDEKMEMSKFELLFVLSQLDLIEKHLHRLEAKVRKLIKEQAVRWRKYLGHTPSRRVIQLYSDPEVLRRLQQAFADIDQDASGKIRHSDLEHFFRTTLKVSIPREEASATADASTQEKIDLDEFLVLVKSSASIKILQARLGIATGAKVIASSAASAVGNYVSSKLGLLGGGSTADKQQAFHIARSALESFREKKQSENEYCLEKKVRKHQASGINYKMDRKLMQNRWHLTVREAFEKIKHASLLGSVTLHETFLTLHIEPSLLKALGFVYQDPRMHLDATDEDRRTARHLKILYEASMERARCYDILSACAEEHELDINTDLDYPAFEYAIWQISSSFRSTEDMLESERQRRQALLENSQKHNAPTSALAALAAAARESVPMTPILNSPFAKSILSAVGFDTESIDTAAPEQITKSLRHKVDDIHEDHAFVSSKRGRELRLHRDGSLYMFL